MPAATRNSLPVCKQFLADDSYKAMHVSYEHGYDWLILKSANFIDSISPELAKFPTEIPKRRRCDKMIMVKSSPRVISTVEVDT